MHCIGINMDAGLDTPVRRVVLVRISKSATLPDRIRSYSGREGMGISIALGGIATFLVVPLALWRAWDLVLSVWRKHRAGPSRREGSRRCENRRMRDGGETMRNGVWRVPGRGRRKEARRYDIIDAVA